MCTNVGKKERKKERKKEKKKKESKGKLNQKEFESFLFYILTWNWKKWADSKKGEHFCSLFSLQLSLLTRLSFLTTSHFSLALSFYLTHTLLVFPTKLDLVLLLISTLHLSSNIFRLQAHSHFFSKVTFISLLIQIIWNFVHLFWVICLIKFSEMKLVIKLWWKFKLFVSNMKRFVV